MTSGPPEPANCQKQKVPLGFTGIGTFGSKKPLSRMAWVHSWSRVLTGRLVSRLSLTAGLLATAMTCSKPFLPYLFFTAPATRSNVLPF